MKTVMKFGKKNIKRIDFDDDLKIEVRLDGEYTKKGLTFIADDPNIDDFWVRMHLDSKDIESLEKAIGKYRVLTSKNKVGAINKLIGALGQVTQGELADKGEELKDCINDILKGIKIFKPLRKKVKK